ncbi:hypothetical protein FVB9288_02378 [Flavobacterium sp. CECT 9288]|nr:hypothetical protein FVB9288_02378 [Flavobacterium sp. CECT 9288]
MDNQDKIFEKIKNASHKAEEKDFPAMEKIWMRVEEKLDEKEDKKAIALWKKLTIAASLLLFFSLGYQFIKTDSKVVKPSGTKENSIVTQEKTEPKQTERLSKTIKPDAEVILKKQIEKPVVVVKTTTQINSNINQITSSNSKDIELSKDKEANVNAYIVEALALEENKAKAKITSTYDATTRMISGIVTDEQDLPLPGVNVYIKGITKGVATNFDGKFSIKAEKGDELVFSYIGYENSYATVGENDKINMKLVNNSMALNEVVVTGYASKPKKSVLMSSVAMISGTDLMKQKSANVSQALQGKIAGVQITNNPGYLSQDSPKPSPTIRIRGKASITQSNEPLYIIDGVPVNPEEFKQLKPENIKTVNVLKDIAATSLYGSRASNGVILLTTKNGTYQNLSKKELEKRLKKLSKNKK